MSWTIYGPHGPEGPQGERGLTWRNSGWITATSYEVDDALLHNGTSYRAYAAHTSGASTEPGVGASWGTVWKELAVKGATGAAGASGATTLDALTDVDTSTTAPTDGQALVYNLASSLWKPGSVASGGGGGTGGGGVLSTGVLTNDVVVNPRPTVDTAVPGLELVVPASTTQRTVVVNAFISSPSGTNSLTTPQDNIRTSVQLDGVQQFTGGSATAGLGLYNYVEEGARRGQMWAGVPVVIPGDGAPHTIRLAYQAVGTTASYTFSHRYMTVVGA